jgi:hypothetical protein
VFCEPESVPLPEKPPIIVLDKRSVTNKVELDPELEKKTLDPLVVLAVCVMVGPTAEPTSPIKVISAPVAVIVTVLPAPEVVIPAPPMTFNTFAAGTAVPAFVTKLSGTEGGRSPAVTPIIN